MSFSTQGIELKTRNEWLRQATELLSSMRFAISLLSIICIASVIGTVLKQNEPVNNYVNQFGPFWSDIFITLSLNTVYSMSMASNYNSRNRPAELLVEGDTHHLIRERDRTEEQWANERLL